MLKSVNGEIRRAGYQILGTRDVPYVYENCGPTAQKAMPGFVQVLIKRPADVQAGRPFEDALYHLRRTLEKDLLGRRICHR